MYKVSIPEISREELLSRYKSIKPIIDIKGKKYFLREFTESELTDISYIWIDNEDIGEIVDMNLFVPYVEKDFECIHQYFGHPLLFKPSIAEILAQIPESEIRYSNISAFEIIEAPKTRMDLQKNPILFENGFHISKVRLYTSPKNLRVYNQK